MSRGFRNLARDDNFWRSRCLQESSFLEVLDRRRRLFRLNDRDVRQAAQSIRRAGGAGAGAVGGAHVTGGHAPTGMDIDAALEGSEGSDDDGGDGRRPLAALSLADIQASTSGGSPEVRERERARIMANWDPCFPSERVSWYDEYIQRHGPVAINWMQCAYKDDKGRGRATFEDFVEARGVALYHPDSSGPGETILAVSPLDDGSVCLWDVRGTRGRRGAIVGRSKPGILFVDGPGAENNRRSKRIDSGVTECVSVDSWKHRAFFAVQSRECARRQECKGGMCVKRSG